MTNARGGHFILGAYVSLNVPHICQCAPYAARPVAGAMECTAVGMDSG